MTLYDVLVALHAICAVMGFGAVALSGIYGASAGKPDRTEETNRYFSGRGWAEWLILLMPFLGVGALATRSGANSADFGQLWVIAGWVAWLLASAVLLGIVRPAEREIRARAADHSTREAGRRLMWGGIACDAMFVLALAVMVTQP